jgi:ElaB/YqjD/DUF883 family membrane-anchored ribosome-binding protein
MSDDGVIFKHESFGQLAFHRIHVGGGKALYGSTLIHSEVIRMTLTRSQQSRSLHENRYFPREILFEVDLSPLQFAELITKMNVGSGIPVTLYRIMGKQLNQCLPKDERVLFTEEFQQRINKVTAAAQTLIEKADELLSQKTPLKASEKSELKNLLATIQMELKSNMQFTSTMFQETVEQAVSDGKQEIETFWKGLVEQLGVQQLAEKSKPPAFLPKEEG